MNEYLTQKNVKYCEAIAIHLYPDVLKMIYDKEFPNFLKSVDEIQPSNYQKIKGSQLLKSYIESLQFYFDNPALVSEELLKLKLKELILLLAKTDNLQKIKNLLNNMFSKKDIDFKSIIEANIYNDLSINELAILTNLSLSSFKRSFKNHYEISPAKYIKQRRLEKATELLKATNLRISDIAFDTGFNDLAHFSKSFQAKYKLSPSEFRQNFNLG